MSTTLTNSSDMAKSLPHRSGTQTSNRHIPGCIHTKFKDNHKNRCGGLFNPFVSNTSLANPTECRCSSPTSPFQPRNIPMTPSLHPLRAASQAVCPSTSRHFTAAVLHRESQVVTCCCAVAKDLRRGSEVEIVIEVIGLRGWRSGTSTDQGNEWIG